MTQEAAVGLALWPGLWKQAQPGERDRPFFSFGRQRIRKFGCKDGLKEASKRNDASALSTVQHGGFKYLEVTVNIH